MYKWCEGVYIWRRWALDLKVSKSGDDTAEVGRLFQSGIGPIRKHEYSDANRLQAVIDYEIGIRLI